MKTDTKTSTDVVELNDTPPQPLASRRSSDAEAVAKLGLTPTVPRSLDKLIGLIGLNSSVVCPWPTFVFVSVLNLANGGTAGLLVGTIIACVFMGPVYISLAEKIRRYPTAGGQYHWVAALAPASSRRFLSFFCCCLLTFTWLSYLAAATWQFGLDITAIVLIYTGEYHVKYTFAAAIGIQVVSLIVNLTWGKHMNIPESLVVLFHFVAFFFLLGLLANASATGIVQPNLTFTSFTGWSPSFGVCLSIDYAVSVLIGFDCASHVGLCYLNTCEGLFSADFMCSGGHKGCQQAHSKIPAAIDYRQQDQLHHMCRACRTLRRRRIDAFHQSAWRGGPSPWSHYSIDLQCCWREQSSFSRAVWSHFAHSDNVLHQHDDSCKPYDLLLHSR